MTSHSDLPIFGLDIGTRSVVGLLLKNNKPGYEILDVEIQEHEDRSMLDGQIHNVLSVTKVITSIKEKLEHKHGPLRKVCVAAAGRSLKTKRAIVALDISKKPIFEHQDILHLELSAVQKAQYEIAKEYEGKSVNYFCVGYSVLSYQLDGEEIGSLVDQSGYIASVEVIATFLPKVVVESLLAALSRSGLELEALTLEPIAAINVLIPPTMRRLNVALVDIGAGTSDIAITDSGTVTAYGMVPIAGDEITEAISDHFLLDFPEAEIVKRQLTSQDEVVLTDILGFETSFSKEDIIEPISKAIETLATEITTEILNLNKKSPKAVMLVGGGSLTPNLARYIANSLQLPENRVAVRGIDAIKSLIIPEDIKAGPELVTPIGIAIAAKESPVEYVSIKVNDQIIRLFDIKKLTVGDGLLAAGIELSKLYGKPGMAIMVKVNERLISIPGEHGQPPRLEKNHQSCSLDTPLKDGDTIIAQSGANGKDAKATISDVIETLPTKAISINGKMYNLQATIIKNGQQALLTEKIEDRDEIIVQSANSIEEVLASLKLYDMIEQIKPFNVHINGSQVIFNVEDTLVKNGKKTTKNALVQDGDFLLIKMKSQPFITLEELLIQEKIEASYNITVYFNGESIEISKPLVIPKRGDELLTEKSRIYAGDSLTITLNKKETFIFQDIFRFVDFNLTAQENKTLIILRNEKDATFSTPIHNGDHLEIKWAEKKSNKS
ncbi:cell division protein [Anaerobacillus alkalidiazotrophicus]|uniref:Cell division protein n=1 Tax=Anaerobacillus alkalidiazotrophicus TaxID=472963 RepID=A0A1S2M3M5_9BACI|nr:cell division FtsA domain-containing protein [Anaerobacillus alkalidiazotrophicus]OIJ18225.1 cell division protein [Anaerobacillus alkalidiazotrophicus]OIJ19704.1 cell division protein [Anaerobacillus alkalidiazotrophicus]